MNVNTEILISSYQNCKTAIQSINDILPKVKNKSLQEELKKENEEYQKLSDKCEQMARSEKLELKDNSWLEKTKLWTSIKMSTMLNNSTRKIAELMLIGTVMGTLQCYKDLEDYKTAKESLKELTRIIMRTEEIFFENLKKFLKPVEE